MSKAYDITSTMPMGQQQQDFEEFQQTLEANKEKKSKSKKKKVREEPNPNYDVRKQSFIGFLHFE